MNGIKLHATDLPDWSRFLWSV